MKQFYTHLTQVESLIVELSKMDLSNEERIHLSKLVDSTLHHTILDAVLSELSDSEKVIFLRLIKEADNDRIWRFLNERVDKIEDKIKKAADDLKMELHKDLLALRYEKL